MKLTNFKKRERNGKITTIIVTATMILLSLLYVGMSMLIIPDKIKIPLLLICGVILIGIIPFLLLKFQFVIYDYLNKTIDIVESNLSSEFKTIFLKDITCLKKSALALHQQRTYKAKLEADESITILIENEFDSSDNYIQNTSDYSWFLSLFKFEA